MTTGGTKTPGTPVRSGAKHTVDDNVGTEGGLHGQASEIANTVVWPVFPRDSRVGHYWLLSSVGVKSFLRRFVRCYFSPGQVLV